MKIRAKTEKKNKELWKELQSRRNKVGGWPLCLSNSILNLPLSFGEERINFSAFFK